MLKAVAFKNFVLFKDYQRLKFENGPYFCVGPNGSGKSSFYELIRRCLSSEWNLSSSNIYNNSKPAFIICEYFLCDELSSTFKIVAKLGFKPDALHACRFALSEKDNAENHYKMVCLQNRANKQCKIYLEMYKIDSSSDELCVDEKLCGDDLDIDVIECVKSLTQADSQDKLDIIVNFLDKNRGPTLSQKAPPYSSECEKCLHELTLSIAQIFGKRSVDHTQLAGARQRGPVYGQISERAQILDKLLCAKEVDRQKEKQFFNALTLPHHYEFKKEDNQIKVTNKTTRCQTSLLKTSNGVVESKQLSLLFACKKYQTIILDDIERAMHPQMIRNLRELVLRRINDKTILLSTNSAELISQWTIPRTFVFSYKMERRSCQTKVRSIDASILKTVSSEEMKKVLYCPYVLFVEGLADKMVLYAILHHVQCLLENEAKHEIFLRDLLKVDKSRLEPFHIFLVGLYIVPQFGKTCHNNTLKFCETIGVPSMYVYDKDTFIHEKTGAKDKLKEHYGVNIRRGETNIEKINREQEKKNIFMWNKGCLERVVYGDTWTKSKTGSCHKLKVKASTSKSVHKKFKPDDSCKRLVDLEPTELQNLAKKLIDNPNEDILRFLDFLVKMCSNLNL